MLRQIFEPPQRGTQARSLFHGEIDGSLDVRNRLAAREDGAGLSGTALWFPKYALLNRQYERPSCSSA